MKLANSPMFIAERYRVDRPFYPRPLFRGLESLALASPVFLDLGCGAGQSTWSFLDLGISATGYAVDPDAAMLAEAFASLNSDYPEVTFSQGAAEAIPVGDQLVDLVLIGSAIHWFDVPRAKAEIERVLKPRGILAVFEYQFPKCLDRPDLAETVRRRFNLEWKAPVQKPRGTLAEILGPFEQGRDWIQLSDERPSWRPTLNFDEFLGHLFSQSRYLHVETASADPSTYRKSVADSLAEFFEAGPLHFDLKPRILLLRKSA